MHCAAINNQTEIIEHIISDLQLTELDKDDQVSCLAHKINKLNKSTVHTDNMLACTMFCIFQSGHRPFALAAEHGCVEMLKILTDPYNMATMKPDKVCVCPFHGFIASFLQCL